MEFNYIRSLFNKLDKTNSGYINRDNLKMYLTILNINIDNINKYLTEDKYSFNDTLDIIKSRIKVYTNCHLIKLHQIKSKLETKIDKNTVKIILLKVYGNINPNKKVDIGLLNDFIKSKSNVLELE
jgi:hypothetical protein